MLISFPQCVTICFLFCFVFFIGNHLFWAVSADMSLCGICGCGPACGDQLYLPAPEADVENGLYCQEHSVSCEQYD